MEEARARDAREEEQNGERGRCARDSIEEKSRRAQQLLKIREEHCLRG